MTILIIEDELPVLRYLEDSFRRDGYNVSGLGRLDELDTFLSIHDQSAPSIFILDRLIKNKDSASWIPKIKKRFPGTKILVLSAIGGPQEKGRLLDLGADDYVSKPFSIDELGARIRVLLRTQPGTANPFLSLANVVMNLLNQTVEIQGNKLDLSRKEYLVLKVLMENPRRVFNRYQLLDIVWGIQSNAETNVVEVTMKNLRKKLESGQANLRIMSKRYAGYWVEV